MVNDQDSVPQHDLLGIFIAVCLIINLISVPMHRLVHPVSLQAKGPAKGIPVAEEACAIEHCEVAFRI